MNRSKASALQSWLAMHLCLLAPRRHRRLGSAHAPLDRGLKELDRLMLLLWQRAFVPNNHALFGRPTRLPDWRGLPAPQAPARARKRGSTSRGSPARTRGRACKQGTGGYVPPLRCHFCPVAATSKRPPRAGTTSGRNRNRTKASCS